MVRRFTDDHLRAANFAFRAHGTQMYDSVPYSCHLTDVVSVLCEFGYNDPVLLAAGWLHDVVEDTAVTSEDIVKEFGHAVARVVVAVTDVTGPNREVRKKLSYPVIRSNEWGVCVKLADRIANMRASNAAFTLGSIMSRENSSERLYTMYVREYPEFKSALWLEGEFPGMWAELDRLATHYA